MNEAELAIVGAELQDSEDRPVYIFRLDDGKIIEHWVVLQQVPETTATGNDMFSQLS